MTMRKLLRKRSAFRRILQNLETRPVLQDTPPKSVGWLNQLYPGIIHDSFAPQPLFAKTVADDVRLMAGRNLDPTLTFTEAFSPLP